MCSPNKNRNPSCRSSSNNLRRWRTWRRVVRTSVTKLSSFLLTSLKEQMRLATRRGRDTRGSFRSFWSWMMSMREWGVFRGQAKAKMKFSDRVLSRWWRRPVMRNLSRKIYHHLTMNWILMKRISIWLLPEPPGLGTLRSPRNSSLLYLLRSCRRASHSQLKRNIRRRILYSLRKSNLSPRWK